jgi:ABC-type multidrug transport system ATPase subunit
MDIEVKDVCYYVGGAASTCSRLARDVASVEQPLPNIDAMTCLLKNVSATFVSGTVTALMGPSGAG